MEFTTVLLASALYVLICVVASKWLLHKRLPPGAKLPPMPPAGSIWGHVEINNPDFLSKKALEWASQYGPVYRLRKLFTDIVVINDIENMKKICNGYQLLDRPDIINLGEERYPGISTQCGEVWAANRRFIMTMQRQIGFSQATKRNFMDELHQLSQRIDASNGEPLLVESNIMDCVLKITSSLVYGVHMVNDSTSHKQLKNIMKRFYQALQKRQLFLFWPDLLLKLCLRLSSIWKNEIVATVDQLNDFTVSQIKNYMARSSGDHDPDFITAYLKKIEESKEDPNSAFQYKYLVGNIISVVVGGMLSPTQSMLANLAVFAARLDYQERVQQEIDEVISADRTPCWEDCKKMPFTMACIYEVERYNTGKIFGLPRTNDKDIRVDNIFIPKGTSVLLNLWAANHNPTEWKDPHRFDPNRYLLEDGSLNRQRPDNHVAFSVGKRSCPGKEFGRMEVFLVVTFLLQKYHITLGEPLDVDVCDTNSGLCQFGLVKLRFRSRGASNA